MLVHAAAHGGVRTRVRESALKVDSGRKIPRRTGQSNLPQQQSFIPTTIYCRELLFSFSNSVSKRLDLQKLVLCKLRPAVYSYCTNLLFFFTSIRTCVKYYCHCANYDLLFTAIAQTYCFTSIRTWVKLSLCKLRFAIYSYCTELLVSFHKYTGKHLNSLKCSKLPSNKR